MRNPFVRTQAGGDLFSLRSPMRARSRSHAQSWPLVLASNHCQLNTTTFIASAANHVRCETRTRHTLCDCDFSEIAFVYAGFYLQNGSGNETNVGNDVAISTALEWPGAPTVTVRAKFAGQESGSIPNGAAFYRTDFIKASEHGLSHFPRLTQFWHRRESEVPQGARYGRHEGASPGTSGERSTFSDGLSARQLMGTGSLVLPSGGADASAIMGPVAIIGKPLNAPDIAVAIIGDSIITGNNDRSIGSDGENGGGWAARGLWSRKAAWIKLSVGGAQAVNLANGVKWKEYLQYCSHAIVEPGTNDMAVASRSGQTTWDSGLLPIYAACRAAGIGYIDGATIMPRVNGTYDTVVGQTPVTGFETGGNRRDELNALLADAVPSIIDGVFDVNPDAADGGQPDRFIAGGTNDGTHPLQAVHTAVASRLTTRVANWSR